MKAAFLYDAPTLFLFNYSEHSILHQFQDDSLTLKGVPLPWPQHSKRDPEQVSTLPEASARNQGREACRSRPTWFRLQCPLDRHTATGDPMLSLENGPEGPGEAGIQLPL